MKLEIRYTIDGQQVEAQEFERGKREDLDALIEASKHGLSECLSELDSTYDFSRLKEAVDSAKGMSSRRIEDE